MKALLRPSLPAFLVLAVLLAVLVQGPPGVYGLVVGTILAAKLLVALTYRPYRAADLPGDTAGLRVTAVVPIYNEDPGTLELALRALAGQTRPPQAVRVVDDASADPAGAATARALAAEFAARGIDYRVLVQPRNAGKRAAMGRAFAGTPDTDVYLCVDSDTVLEPDAVGELLVPFADPRVTASTGLVLPSNRGRNLLTCLQELRYAASFLVERAAYTRAGAVLCCSGALSMYRASVIREHGADFLGQRFLGRCATFGDDRRLTNYALLDGRAVFQERALAHTAVPERLSHFVRQQVRWNKSFFRESLWALVHQPKTRPAFWLTVVELGAWAGFSAALAYLLVLHPLTTPETWGTSVTGYLGLVTIMGYLRTVRYLDLRHRGTGPLRRLGLFLLAPLYGVLHLVVLIPVRFYALATLFRTGWGSRQHGVEVRTAT
ncbi:hyaluronan synthase [Sphaerisporangium rufum]|uniref:Hyaluronan synthase n=1 Tax=Sphaerisporangium rufum TaxID=1381558 RepID=A0A919R5G3_9ACTN|nr:glycosyltransferase [Sphaerisporangium rufum]GII80046.1 hyaluronan synthase [Sphaerisporangium rufum]